MTAIVAGVALLVAAVGLVGWWRAARRLAAVEARVARIDRDVHDELVPALERTRRASEEAYAAARLATQAVGIEEPPPRLAGEALTGPVVRAVAFSAGARRALARLASDVTPMAKTRATTARTVRIVGAASRVRSGVSSRTAREGRQSRKAG